MTDMTDMQVCVDLKILAVLALARASEMAYSL